MVPEYDSLGGRSNGIDLVLHRNFAGGEWGTDPGCGPIPDRATASESGGVIQFARRGLVGSDSLARGSFVFRFFCAAAAFVTKFHMRRGTLTFTLSNSPIATHCVSGDGTDLRCKLLENGIVERRR